MNTKYCGRRGGVTGLTGLTGLRVMAGLVVLALLGLAIPVRADQGIQDFGTTNTIRTSTTVSVNLGSAIRIDKQDRCAITMNFAGDAAGTGAQTVILARSIDGTNYETAPRITMIAALNGTTAVCQYTNLTADILGAAGWIKVVSWQNADAGAIATNCFVLLSKKTIKPSP